MSNSSNSVIAKARAVYGRTLTADDYTQMASKETVSDVCAYLKQTERFGAALSFVNPQTVHRGQLEQLLKRTVFDIFEKFQRFDFTESKGYFKYIIEKLEIEQILAALQGVMYGNSDDFIAALPMFLTKYADVDLAALGMAKNLTEAAGLLRGTVYEKAVYSQLTAAADLGELDIIDIERRLYSQYYLSMLRAVENKYKGAEKKDMKRIILRCIDMENVVTLYRNSVIFKRDRDSARSSLIPFKYRLSPEVVERLASQKDVDKIAGELGLIGYKLGTETPDTVEQLTEQISLDYLKKTLRLSQSASVVYFALIELLTIELKNVKTLIEGVRYRLEGSAILDMLVI